MSKKRSKADKDDGSDALTRIAIVSTDKCKPKRCRQECKKFCPVVRMGKNYFHFGFKKTKDLNFVYLGKIQCEYYPKTVNLFAYFLLYSEITTSLDYCYELTFTKDYTY